MPGVALADALTPFILTLDIGSSSTRAMIFDARARSIAHLEARELHSFHTKPDGTAIDDAGQLLQCSVKAIDQLIDTLGDRSADISAVAIDTYAMNLLGLDRSGSPITPIFTYADTRPTEDAAQLREQFDEASMHDRTGCPIRAGYLPASFMWLKRTQPQVLSRVRRWISIGEYLLDQFLGRTGVSPSIASWSGLLNRRTLNWDEDWFKVLPVSIDQFSTLIDANTSLIGLKPEWAARWPALKNVPWYPALGDGAAASIGSGCAAADRLALTIGTSGALRVALNSIPDHVPFGLWSYRIDRNMSLLGGATNEGGNVYTWLRQTLALPPDDQFDSAINTLEPDAHGLTALPFIAGERSPGYAGDVNATITGVSINTRPIEIARAMLEAVAYRFRIIADRIQKSLPLATLPAQVIASGGGVLHRPAWLQIFSDVLNRPVIVSAEHEATSRGAALMALRPIGSIKFLDEVPAGLGEIFEPHADRHAIYLEAAERQQKLYDILITQY